MHRDILAENSRDLYVTGKRKGMIMQHSYFNIITTSHVL